MALQELKEFWFSNPKVWFGCTPSEDLMIKKKFGRLLYISHQENYNNLLSLIILYDQISRHAFRENKGVVKIFDIPALRYSLILLPVIEDYNSSERCFILMPLRHTFKKENLLLCLDYINEWRKTDNVSIYKRFYEATITALTKLHNDELPLYKPLYSSKTKLLSIMDVDSPRLLDSYSFDVNKIKQTSIYTEFTKYLKSINNQVVVSISGGVDSMVSSLLLYIYCLDKNINIVGVCIGYNNRSDQYLEIEMISYWLRSLNLDFYLRNITEIKRTHNKDRDFYEKITRSIRFDAYRKFNCPVILGHNRDDSIENIFSNILKQKNYNNLLGMTHETIENDIVILRPLLNISKTGIINFAKEFDVPYVYDSTPSWSERGSLRDNLIPYVNNYNSHILEGLIKMSLNFTEIYKVYSKSLPNIEYRNNICIVDNHELYFFDYWKNILQQITRYYKMPNVKNKSIQYFITWITNGKKITLNKSLIAKQYLDKIIVYVSSYNK